MRNYLHTPRMVASKRCLQLTRVLYAYLRVLSRAASFHLFRTFRAFRILAHVLACFALKALSRVFARITWSTWSFTSHPSHCDAFAQQNCRPSRGNPTSNYKTIVSKQQRFRGARTARPFSARNRLSCRRCGPLRHGATT